MHNNYKVACYLIAELGTLQNLFIKSPLNSLLASMPTKSFDEQCKDYEVACDKRKVQAMYQINPQQAKRLIECGLSTGKLEELYKSANRESDFDAAIHGMGVNSKPLREKLCEKLHEKLYCSTLETQPNFCTNI